MNEKINRQSRDKIRESDEMNPEKYMSVHFGTIYKKLDHIEKENEENGKIILEVKNLKTS